MFNERLKQLRTEKKLTQATLAEKLEIGKTTLASYEQGKNEPSLNMLIKIADFFEVSIDYLVGKNNCKTLQNQSISSELQLTESSIEALKTISDIKNIKTNEPLSSILNKILSNKHLIVLLKNIGAYSSYSEQDWHEIKSGINELFIQTSDLQESNSQSNFNIEKTLIKSSIMEEFKNILDDIL